MFNALVEILVRLLGIHAKKVKIDTGLFLSGNKFCKYLMLFDILSLSHHHLLLLGPVNNIDD